MKQIMLAFFIIVVLSVAVTPGDCTATPGASAFILEPDFSFGTVAEGNKVTHTFAIENRGDSSLRIMRVQTG